MSSTIFIVSQPIPHRIARFSNYEEAEHCKKEWCFMYPKHAALIHEVKVFDSFKEYRLSLYDEIKGIK
jgi:hypothetical protein